MAPSIDTLIAELPKVELHVHLEGSMTPATLMALAEKNHLDDVLTAIDDP
jgi:aminodeoxyfutalosine deaminase